MGSGICFHLHRATPKAVGLVKMDGPAGNNLDNFLRCLALSASAKHSPLTTPGHKLIKTGAQVVRHARQVMFQMAKEQEQ